MESNNGVQIVKRITDPLGAIDSDYENEYQCRPEYGRWQTPDYCDQCLCPLSKRKLTRGSKECLQCGVWCKDCLNPEWTWYRFDTKGMSEHELGVFKTEKAAEVKTLVENWGQVTKVGYDKKEYKDDDHTCPDCEFDIVNELGLLVSAVILVEGIVGIVNSYVDWQEQSVVKYNWPRQRVPVTCLVCNETRSRMRQWVRKNGNTVTCSRCKYHVVRNQKHFSALVDHRISSIKNFLRLKTPLAIDEPVTYKKNLSIINLISEYDDPTQDVSA
jgi:hypothetical protein